MSRSSLITRQTSLSSSNASSDSRAAHAFQRSSPNYGSQNELISPSTMGLNSGQSSALNSPTQSDASAEGPIHGDPHLPRTTATKRDKLVGKAEMVVAKIVRDPELNERAMLRAAGGKELAEGLATIDSNNI